MTVNWFWVEELADVGMDSVPNNSHTCALSCSKKCVVERKLVVFLFPYIVNLSDVCERKNVLLKMLKLFCFVFL